MKIHIGKPERSFPLPHRRRGGRGKA
jgi:hypothetical protein